MATFLIVCGSHGEISHKQDPRFRPGLPSLFAASFTPLNPL